MRNARIGFPTVSERIRDVGYYLIGPRQWPKTGGWGENKWGYRLTSNSNIVLPTVKSSPLAGD